MKPLSLSKSSLLKKPGEYRHVYKKGSRIQGDGFSLIFTPNDRLENRLGISIHGQLKGAVRRNRIKRIIKEFYRLNRTFLQQVSPETNIGPGMDIIFAVRKNFRLNTLEEVKHAVSSLLHKGRTIKNCTGEKSAFQLPDI